MPDTKSTAHCRIEVCTNVDFYHSGRIGGKNKIDFLNIAIWRFVIILQEIILFHLK